MRDRIDAWRNAFSGDENAVLPTLVNYAWNYSAFAAVAKAVELCPDDETGHKPLNFMMLDLLRSSYWGSAVLAIRRLVDGGPLAGPFGVSSLRSILNDVKACRNRLTRRIYVEEISNLPYNYEVVERLAWEHLLANGQNGAIWMPRDLQPEPSRQRHIEFDFLCGVTSSASTPDDLISWDIFDRLEARLAEVDRIAEHATVYFAHASTAESRRGRHLDTFGPTDARAALKLLTETAELIGRWFIFEGAGNILPHPQYDQFAHLDKPILPGNDATLLQAQWDEFAEEAEKWPMIENKDL